MLFASMKLPWACALSSGLSQGDCLQRHEGKGLLKTSAVGLLLDLYIHGPPNTIIIFLIRGCYFAEPSTNHSLFLRFDNRLKTGPCQVTSPARLLLGGRAEMGASSCSRAPLKRDEGFGRAGALGAGWQSSAWPCCVVPKVWVALLPPLLLGTNFPEWASLLSHSLC